MQENQQWILGMAKAKATPKTKAKAKAAPKAKAKAAPKTKAKAAPTAKAKAAPKAKAKTTPTAKAKAAPKAKAKTTRKAKATPKPRVAAGNNAFTLHGLEPYKEKKNEEYMNESQLDHFKQILLAWKRELMEEVDRTVNHMKDEAANFPDPADRATQEEEFSLELRTRDRERKLIKKIDKTLIRVEDDDYGFCDQCGVEIGIRRLEARPTADLCVDCKTLDEIKEKQITGG